MVATYVPGPHGPMVFSSTAGAGAGIAFVGAADGGNNGGSTSSLTFSYTAGAGSNRLLVVGALGDSSVDDVTGATYAGSAMTLAAKLAPGGPVNRWAYLFWKVGPASGANNVVISASSTHFILAGAADYSGVNPAGQPDATTTQAGSGSITSLTTSITTAANNSWTILLENSFDANIPPTAGSGLVRRATDAAFGGWGLFDSNGAITPAGSYSMTTTRTNSSNTIDHVVASFKP
jgi:hypothetical protein